MDQARFVSEERIDVVRRVANSRDERDQIKAELESQGFTVMVRETATPPVEGEYYTAALFAEKREPVTIDTWAIERDRMELERRGRRIDVATKVGFWIAVALGLLFLLWLMSPLIRTMLAL